MTLAMTSDFVRELLDSDGNVIYFPNSTLFTKLFPNGLSIDNVMFTIPGINLDIYWYGFLIALGMVLAMIYAFSRCKKFGLDIDRVTDTVLAGLIGGIIGARLYYVIFSIDNYMTEEGTLDFSLIFNIRDGGLAIYGGIIGGLLIGGIMAKIRKVKLAPMLDLAGMGFLIGQCLGRWGNFFNQEAYGYSETFSAANLPWGMVSKSILNGIYYFVYPDNTSVVTNRALSMIAHPCFLYESLWCLLGFILLHIYSKHRKFDGQLFLMYIGWYGFGRFWIEGLRTDSLYLINNDVISLKVSQLLAGACFMFAVIMLIYMHVRGKKLGGYVLYCDTDESKAFLKEAYKKTKKGQNESLEEDEHIVDENQHILADEFLSDGEEEIAEEEESEPEEAESEPEETEATEPEEIPESVEDPVVAEPEQESEAEAENEPKE
ncbi:MAG: prolipoprotein diacylglyceryl transferase [Oscillospiraceae bacterium]|nr:prolipoprotein diacylglyceryl transferase [Oscillospiraceae bacterium]